MSAERKNQGRALDDAIDDQPLFDRTEVGYGLSLGIGSAVGSGTPALGWGMDNWGGNQPHNYNEDPPFDPWKNHTADANRQSQQGVPKAPKARHVDASMFPKPNKTLTNKYNLKVDNGTAEEIREVATPLVVNITKAEDLCKTAHGLCDKNLGIPRIHMPQLNDTETTKFLNSMKDDGISVRKEDLKVRKIHATQKEINAKKVRGMLAAYKKGDLDLRKKIVVVSTETDGGHYLLDGHHRWAALFADSPSNRIPAMVVGDNIRNLLQRADEWDGTEHQGF